jgi:subtilisin-like proprotein convertase family protein
VAFSGTGSAISRARVTFSEAMNATTFAVADATLTGPGGRSIAISGVSAVSATQFDVTFANQSAAGTYTLAVGPFIRDIAGNMMAQRATATTTLLSGAQTFTSTNVGKTIADFGQVISTLTINQDIAIRDLNVTVNMSHTYTGDVRMTLVGPDGTRVPLVNRRGGSSDNFVNTTFDDEASVGVWQGTGPWSGSYRPEYALSAFDGKSTRGTWQLIVEDTALFDTGRLNGWSLTVQGAAGAAAARQAVLPTPPTVSGSGEIAWWGGVSFCR